MLIIKKFHDYYDSAIGFGGVDKTCVYQRIPQVEGNKYEIGKITKMFEGEKRRWHTGPYSHDYYKYRYSQDNPIPKGMPYAMHPFLIGFCGKTYVGYSFKWGHGIDETTKISYDIDEILKLYKFTPIGRGFSNAKEDKDTVVKYFEQYHNKEHKELFVKYHVPAFVLDYGAKLAIDDFTYLPSEDEPVINYDKLFMVNPRFANYEFYQMFNPAQAFQEIQMYLQGVLGNKEKEIIEISEKDKLIQHGMDKWSFRNPCPPKRKGNCLTKNATKKRAK